MPSWDDLESWARGQIQELVQGLLEVEVTELLGRMKGERRSTVDGSPGYRNGYGKPRSLSMSNGTITVKRPRVRDLEKRFESRVLPLFVRRTREVRDLLPELYLHGLSLGDFDLALRGLLGERAPISPSTVARLKTKWTSEWAEWSSQSLEGLEPVYLWADGVYVKAGLDKEKAALLVVIAALSDGSKRVLSVSPGYRESEASWSAVLRDLRDRGLVPPQLVIADGHLGIWAALRNVWPEADEQGCWNHKIINVLDKLPRSRQAEAKKLLCQIPYAETLAEAVERKAAFQRWCRKRGYHAAAETLDRNWDRMVTFYNYPREHWRHLRTTNPVESPFAALRLRTGAAKRFQKVQNATAVLWRLLMVAESRFRAINLPALAKEVFDGATFKDGLLVQEAAA